MRINDLINMDTILNESTNSVAREIVSNNDFQTACDLINDGGQLSWVLTISRLKGKLGSIGLLYGLYDNDELIGTVGLKETRVGGYTGVEVGYLYIHPDHRNFSNYMKLYAVLVPVRSSFKFIFMTTNTTNNTINTLMKRNNYVDFAFEAKSPFSNNRLNYWVVTGTELDDSTVINIFKDKFMTESRKYSPKKRLHENSNGEVVITRIPTSTLVSKEAVTALFKGMRNVRVGDPDTVGENDVEIRIGGNLPTNKKNTIVLANAYHGKRKQYNMLSNKVNMIPTNFGSKGEIGDQFIAKRDHGWKQAGQLINQMPSDDEVDSYIFQPLVSIKAEYRAIVYFMNGEYHLSGIYRKSGSNMSFVSVTSGEVYDKVKTMAIEATKGLGYGFGGADIVLTDTKLNEWKSVANKLGGVASTIGKMAGKLSKDSLEGNEVYLLEVNTMPSMDNPMIRRDLIESIMRNKI